MKPLSRRSVTTGLAAHSNVIALVPRSKAPTGGPDSLAALIAELCAKEKAWEANTDEKLHDLLYDEVVEPAENAIIDVPATSAEDALAAMDYLIDQDLIETYAGNEVIEWLAQAIRDYLCHEALRPHNKGE